MRSTTSVNVVGLVGFGAFGRLVAQHLAHRVALCAYDPILPTASPPMPEGVTSVSLAEAASCPVVVFAVPVSRLEEAVRAAGPHLRRGALVLDVGSVKSVSAEIMRREVPAHADIVATHPLFGPQSAAAGIRGLRVVVCPIRGARSRLVTSFLRTLGLDVIVTTPDAHDREVAIAQGLTHLIAKVLIQMEPLPTRMTTRSFDLLMQGVEMVRHDAPEVFEAIEKANPHAGAVRRRFFDLMAKLDADLSHSTA